jgi:glycosyltransferase involved in cell wall biosynthesis
MNKLRINLLTPIPFWHPGTTEFIESLRSEGYEIIALDIWSFSFYDKYGVTHNLVPKLFRGTFARIYKRLFRQRIIRTYINEGDIVDIQWCGHYYSNYMGEIKNQNVKIFASLFGSDLYRTNMHDRIAQRKIFEVADKIVMGVNMQQDFEAVFSGFTEKIVFAQFGSKRIDLINEMSKTSNKQGLRDGYGILSSKIVVTVGYNSMPQQQHLLFLNELKNQKSELKEKLFLLIPMTYGSDNGSEYYTKLKQRIAGLGVEFLCIENRLTDIELAETKIISDITVNLQITDALSSSIKEAMTAKDVVLVGDWLPYDIYEELGVYFERSSLEDFFERFLEILENLDQKKIKCKNNALKIVKFASWKYITPQFIKNYNS